MKNSTSKRAQSTEMSPRQDNKKVILDNKSPVLLSIKKMMRHSQRFLPLQTQQSEQPRPRIGPFSFTREELKNLRTKSTLNIRTKVQKTKEPSNASKNWNVSNDREVRKILLTKMRTKAINRAMSNPNISTQREPEVQVVPNHERTNFNFQWQQKLLYRNFRRSESMSNFDQAFNDQMKLSEECIMLTKKMQNEKQMITKAINVKDENSETQSQAQEKILQMINDMNKTQQSIVQKDEKQFIKMLNLGDKRHRTKRMNLYRVQGQKETELPSFFKNKIKK